ncbi:MAG: NitT/TauT family transport system ATP-binding protein [Azoarcus sp.]|nr:NitT/TauT family transport system ATP-binding protein [Azoarcus sp.]
MLVARQLAFSYGRTPVFADVDLSIERQEIVCLIGASGSGKSTLLRLLAGLTEPGAGTVTLAGGEVDRVARASVVFQSPALLPWLTVAANVGFGLDFACRPREDKAARQTRIDRALEQVGLAAHARKKPVALSGGMAQRVALARALARDPEIIYLDEPFSALDAITRESMQDLLLELAHRQRSAALLVTHDIDEALRIGDRVLLLAASGRQGPAHIVGEWRPEGPAPRQHRSVALNAMREEILESLSGQIPAWSPIL